MKLDVFVPASTVPGWRLVPLLLVVLSACCAWPGSAAARPNLVWIMADNLGYGELGCYGQREIQTPHLDRMASEGLRFTQFYAGATVCAPSRSVLMTGQHHGHTRVRGNAGPANPRAQAPSCGGCHGGENAPAGRLCHRAHRQMGPG